MFGTFQIYMKFLLKYISQDWDELEIQNTETVYRQCILLRAKFGTRIEFFKHNLN